MTEKTYWYTPITVDTIDDAPQDGKMYLRKNGGWVENPVGITHIDEWSFNETRTEPPGAGQIRMNSIDQPTASNLWVSNTTAPGVDVSAFLGLVEPGWILSIQDKDVAGKRQSYFVRAITINPTYVDFTVESRMALAPLAAQRVMMMMWGTKVL